MPEGSLADPVAQGTTTRRIDVSPALDGVLPPWIVPEGDLVDAGDPIARPYPEVTS